MNEQLRKDLDQLNNLLEEVSKQSVGVLMSLDERSTSAPGMVQQNVSIPANGSGASEALRQFNERFEKMLVASTGPRYLGFVTGGVTPAALMGDWLTSVYDQNTQAINGNGDVSARIELETISLLLGLFGLPKDYYGGFVTGATMSNFTCLAVARQWLGRKQNKDIARDGISFPLKVLSATPHSSAIKSLAMLGMGSNNLLKVETLTGNREAMDIDDLERKLQSLNGESSIVISSGGTVNTVDFDDMTAIAELKKKYSFWWHIDAAFGAFAACSPAYQHLLEGWQDADSITVDNHKWLNVPYDSAIFLVKEEHRLLQIESFQNSNAPYLGDPMANFSYMNIVPENSRRLRALPAWFTLMAYGKNGYREIVEKSIDIAKELGRRIDSSNAFELLAPVRLNTVCFTLKGEKDVQEYLNRLTNGGKVFMTPTVYNGTKGIRAAFVNWRTDAEDVELIWKELNSYYPPISTVTSSFKGYV